MTSEHGSPHLKVARKGLSHHPSVECTGGEIFLKVTVNVHWSKFLFHFKLPITLHCSLLPKYSKKKTLLPFPLRHLRMISIFFSSHHHTHHFIYQYIPLCLHSASFLPHQIKALCVSIWTHLIHLPLHSLPLAQLCLPSTVSQTCAHSRVLCASQLHREPRR